MSVVQHDDGTKSVRLDLAFDTQTIGEEHTAEHNEHEWDALMAEAIGMLAIAHPGLSVRLETRRGPGGGWPEVELRGTETALREAMASGWGMDRLEQDDALGIERPPWCRIEPHPDDERASVVKLVVGRHEWDAGTILPAHALAAVELLERDTARSRNDALNLAVNLVYQKLSAHGYRPSSRAESDAEVERWLWGGPPGDISFPVTADPSSAIGNMTRSR